MENPYTKTEMDDDWANAYCVPRELKLRWLWFKNTGCLWMSSRSIKMRHQHPRDYIEPILWRCVRRYGYLNEEWFRDAYVHIQDKHNWHSTAHRHIPQLKQYGMGADGEFCEVDFENPEKECPVCGGSNGYLYSKYTSNPDDKTSKNRHDIWRIWNLNNGYGGWYYQLAQGGRWVEFRCKDKNCAEVIKFVNGEHHLAEEANQIGVKRNLPMTKVKNAATAGEAFLLTAAAMVDFEARFNERVTKLETGE